MAWSRPSLSTLVTRIEADITSRLTGNAPLLRRSLLAILARVWAGAVHILHGFLAYLALQLFVRTADTDYLTEHGFNWGVNRLAATFATGTVIVTGVNGTIIPEGTIFVRDDGVEYESTSEEEIASGTATVSVTCSESGLIGNAETGVILTLQTPITDADDSATVASPGIVGGTDEETDTAYRARILARIQNPPAGGAAADYIAWAKSIAGVKNAWVEATYYGPGTVAVIISGMDADPTPSAPLIAEVQDYIDTVRPVTAAVTVAGVVPNDVDIIIAIRPNTADIQAAILASLEQFFEDEAEPGGVLYWTHLNDAIATAGVLDHAITTYAIDGSLAAFDNYSFTDFNFPVLGSLTFSTLS